MNQIPIAFCLLGVLAALYALVLRFHAKTEDARTRRQVPSDKHSQ